MANITDLPPEILLRIFQFYLADANQHDLIKYLSRVCKMWKAVCLDRTLWVKFDGTVKYKTMKMLYRKGCLNHTKELTVSETECMEDIDADNLFSGLQNLEVINLSNVGSFSRDVFSILQGINSNLKEIHIQRRKKYKNQLIFRYLDLKSVFFSKGENLTTIKLSNCTTYNLKMVLLDISKYCPLLEHLQVTDNIDTHGEFPVKRFQLNCPKLKTLHLDYKITLVSGKHHTGFPNLEAFSYNDLCSISRIRDLDINCLLFNSPKLNFLSLINCSVSVETLCSLPANYLEYLFIPRSKIVNSNNLSDVFKKWCYSLKQVDVSYSNNMAVNNAMRVLATLPNESKIEFLDLSYTQITSDTVGTILQNCRQMEELHLNSCRNLGRGLKKNYKGKTELSNLFENLQNYAYDDSTDEEMQC